MSKKLKIHGGDIPGKVFEVKPESPKQKVATMSKDIWHKPVETPDVDDNLIIDDWTNRTYELGYFDDKDMIFRNLRNDDTYFEESMMRWCDVNELIDDYNRTCKALDVAVDELTKIKVAAESVGIDFFMTAAISALVKIKTELEKKDK